MPPPAKRRLLKRIVAAAALGLLTSLALPWAVICFGPERWLWLPSTGLSVSMALYLQASPRAADPVWVSYERGPLSEHFVTIVRDDPADAERHLLPPRAQPLPRWVMLPQDIPPPHSSETVYYVSTWAYGWPRSCLLRTEMILKASHTRVHGWSIERPRPRRPWSGMDARIPLKPIWSGLLINTALFALPWALLLTALRRLADARARRRRGRCPRCGYNLAGLTTPTCPECGASLTPTQTSPPPSPTSST